MGREQPKRQAWGIGRSVDPARPVARQQASSGANSSVKGRSCIHSRQFQFMRAFMCFFRHRTPSASQSMPSNPLGNEPVQSDLPPNRFLTR